jgi:hypothetical protein
LRHHATPRFWRAYYALPVEVQRLADEKYALLKENLGHPSLHFKQVGDFVSARVGSTTARSASTTEMMSPGSGSDTTTSMSA